MLLRHTSAFQHSFQVRDIPRWNSLLDSVASPVCLFVIAYSQIPVSSPNPLIFMSSPIHRYLCHLLSTDTGVIDSNRQQLSSNFLTLYLFIYLL